MAEKIYTENAPAAIGPYSQAVVVNGMVYSSGQIAIVPATGNIEASDIKAVLTAAGTSMDKIIKTTCFLAEIADFAAFNEVYGQYITEKPARSCVAVKDLPKGALVEVEVIAVVD